MGNKIIESLRNIRNTRNDQSDDRSNDAQPEPEATTNDVRELLDLVTQKTRFTLIQNIVAHPKGMPSLQELDYVNPSKSKSTIRNHLEELLNHGVVETVELPEDQRSRDLPWKFYRLTDGGRKFLENHGLLKEDGTLQEMHSMLEKTDKIEKFENAPRPGDDSPDREDGDADEHRVEA